METDPDGLITFTDSPRGVKSLLSHDWKIQSYSFPLLPAGGFQNNPINFLKILPSAWGSSAPCAQTLSQSLKLLCLRLQMIASRWWTRRNLLHHHAPLQPESQSVTSWAPHLIFCLLKAYGLILTQSCSMPFLFLPTLMEKSPCGTLCNSSIVRILSSPAIWLWCHKCLWWLWILSFFIILFISLEGHCSPYLAVENPFKHEFSNYCHRVADQSCNFFQSFMDNAREVKFGLLCGDLHIDLETIP